MKAIVLSAGLGTRLQPHTLNTPKPLFPVHGRPIIDIIIRRLVSAGVVGIAVNTYYMAAEIESFLSRQRYGIDIRIRREHRLLGTGGAVGNFSDFLADEPFVVINSDILTDIDIMTIYEAHRKQAYPVTLIMHDHPIFNKVSVDPGGFVHGFSGKVKNAHRLLAFTGIAIVDPAIFSYIKPGEACCIIDIYRRMIRAGEKIAAHTVTGHYWNDLGTPERFRDAAADRMMPAVFEKAFGQSPANGFHRQKLAGDGSDRIWYRVTHNGRAVIMADHGIHSGPSTAQIDAFAAIGRHLHKNGIPVPEIYDIDRFSGLAFMQDLGDTLLQQLVSTPATGQRDNHADPETILAHYRAVIDILVKMSVYAKTGFDPAWAYEGARYDRAVIIEKECRYFTARFLQDYLGFRDFSEAALSKPFARLADAIQANACDGLMHRDFQSRNIMVKNGRHYLIDFQGARIGPVQYDLASLLTDPYVNLDRDMREQLLYHALGAMENITGGDTLDRDRFIKGYRYCCISRLMQALGAYAFLSRVRKKAWFETYIPAALDSLQSHLADLPDACADTRLAALSNVVSAAGDYFKSQKGALKQTI